MVGVETIRFYQRKGLLPESEKFLGAIRRYGSADFSRVRFIKTAQQLGLGLDEVAELLKLEDGTHCREARALAKIKLAGVRGKLASLRRMEKMLASCDSRRGKVCCPMIESIKRG